MQAAEGVLKARKTLFNAIFPMGKGKELPVGNKVPSVATCGFVDESYGPSGTLRDVWANRGQQPPVDHGLPKLSSLSPTSSTGINYWVFILF